MPDLTIVAQTREERGKNAARRRRVAGMIPGILYGNRVEPISVTLNPKDIVAILKSAQGENTLFRVKVGQDGEAAQVMIRDYQLDPVTHALLHADLLRIAADKTLHLDIPVELVGEPAGVKDGGILDHVLREVKVECLPANIPQAITVDVSSLVIGAVIRLRDVQPPEGVEFLTEPDVAIATLEAPRKEEEEVPAEAAATEPAEPEVLKKGKAAEEGEEEEGEKK